MSTNTAKPARKATPAPRKATTRRPADEGFPPAPEKGKPAATPASAPKPAPANCACGCGKPTITAKAVFLSGHDARHAGNVGRGLAAGDASAVEAFAALSPRLQAKAEGVRATAERKANEKAARIAAREAAKKAFDAAMAS